MLSEISDKIEFGLNPISGNSGEYLFDFGFYLEATEINKDIATKGATVFIEGNTSATGGGGIGGNGYMELGYQPPAAGTLLLKKIVTGQNPDTDREFTFTVTLASATGAFSGTPVITRVDREGTDNDVNWSNSNINGSIEIKLKAGEYVTFAELPIDTKYKITEKSENGFETTIVATGEREINESEHSVSGALGDKVGVLVEFTNKTLTYELPETGGGSNATYIFIGGALLAAVVAGVLIYKKCSKKRNGCQ